jgi:hypothetical protein
LANPATATALTSTSTPKGKQLQQTVAVSPEFLFKKFCYGEKSWIDEIEGNQVLLMVLMKDLRWKCLIEQGINSKNQKTEVDWENVWQEFVWVLWQELDPKVTNQLNQEQFVMVLTKDWTQVLKKSINQGSAERMFIKRLRDTTTKKRKDDAEKLESNSKKGDKLESSSKKGEKSGSETSSTKKKKKKY